MQEQKLNVRQKHATNYPFFHMALEAHLTLDTSICFDFLSYQGYQAIECLYSNLRYEKLKNKKMWYFQIISFSRNSKKSNESGKMGVDECLPDREYLT